MNHSHSIKPLFQDPAAEGALSPVPLDTGPGTCGSHLGPKQTGLNTQRPKHQLPYDGFAGDAVYHVYPRPNMLLPF
jgi:hypothetical protein